MLVRGWVVLACVALTPLLSAPARAQQPQPTPSLQNLAKAVHNPFEDFVKVPIQATTGFNVGNNHSAGEGLNVQPLVPIQINPQWDLLVRPSMTMAYVPTPNSQFGLSDSQVSLYMTPESASEWIWGVGPIFQFPTASSTDLGTGR